MRGSGAVSGGWEYSRALRAAVGAPEVAEAAWRELMSATAFDEIAEPTQRVMPVIFRNLGGRPGLPEQDRMRGAFKHCWSRSHDVLRAARPVLESLRSNGIDIRVVDAAAVQALGGGAGARMLWKLDLLVGEAGATRAVALLTAAGLADRSPGCGRHPGPAGAGIRVFGDGLLRVDLSVAGADRPVLAAMLAVPAQERTVAETVLPVPPAELLVLAAADRGRSADRTERMQALVDVALLAPQVDPARLAEAARRTGTLPALVWADGELRAAGAPSLGLDLRGAERGGVVVDGTVEAARRLVAPAVRLSERVRSRQRGPEALAAVHDDFAGARRTYEAWLRGGQLAATERAVVRMHGGFLPQPTGTWVLGTSARPFREGAVPGLMASPVAEETIDWRFRVELPGPQKRVRVRVSSPSLDRQDVFVFRNGVPVGRVVAGDLGSRVWEFDGIAASQEFSLRPVWPVCGECYESLGDVVVTIDEG